MTLVVSMLVYGVFEYSLQDGYLSLKPHYKTGLFPLISASLNHGGLNQLPAVLLTVANDKLNFRPALFYHLITSHSSASKYILYSYPIQCK